MGSWLTVLLDMLANKYIILVIFNSSIKPKEQPIQQLAEL